MTRKLLVILGVPIDDLTVDEALDRLDEFVRIGRETGKYHQVATVNADFVVKALSDPELRGILQGVDMATADGMPLVWGARLLGVSLAGRVTGADMVPALAERATAKGYRLYLLGAAPGVAARAAEVLCARHPGLQIVGVASPPYGPILEMDPAIAEEVRRARPDILLVAFGNPKQEKWISMYAPTLRVPVMIGVGGTLDLIAGVLRRAPDWMQRAGLEWVYRLAQEPKRLWRRYVIDLAGFGAFFVRQWWIMRRGAGSGASRSLAPLAPANAQAPVGSAAPSVSEALVADGVAILALHGRLDRANQDAFVEEAGAALKITPYLIVDMSLAEFLDSSALGSLISLTKRAREAGGELVLAAVPEQVATVLGLLRLDRFFELRPDVERARIELARHAGRGEDLSTSAVSPAAPLAEPDAAPPEPGAAQMVIVPMPRRLDATTAPEMELQCSSALAPGLRLILDFSQTVFLASAGMAAMIKLHRLAQGIGAELLLAGCTSDVLRTLTLTRLDRILPLYPDVDAAARSPSVGVPTRLEG